MEKLLCLAIEHGMVFMSFYAKQERKVPAGMRTEKQRNCEKCCKTAAKGRKFFLCIVLWKTGGHWSKKTDAPPPEHPVFGGGAREVYGEKRAVCRWQTAENETIWKKNKKCLTSACLKWYNKALIYRKMETPFPYFLVLLYHEWKQESRCLKRNSNNKTVCVIFRCRS